MAKGGSSKSSSARSFGGAPRASSSASREVSSARLHQKSGTSFGGYTKVARPDGTFTMKKTGGR